MGKHQQNNNERTKITRDISTQISLRTGYKAIHFSFVSHPTNLSLKAMQKENDTDK